MSASKTKRNRNTCVPRADSGTRAHAFWPLWILFLLSSPFSPLLPSLLSLSSLSSFFLSFGLLFFIHTILHTRLHRFHRSTESARRLYFYSPRIAMSDRSDLFSFSIQYYATIENVRSVSRVRGKRCHVHRLPTSMMQLAFNPHSRILELNSTVQRQTGSH